MHHPHVPHELKDFGKHLLATFLGLLMAVGLESWHQEHSRASAAREARTALLEEVRTNQKALLALKQDCEQTLTLHEKTMTFFEAVIRKRQQSRSRELGVSGAIYVKSCAGTFKTAAWTIAVSAQHISRFPREEAERCSDFYEDLRELVATQLQEDFHPSLLPFIQALHAGSHDEVRRHLEEMEVQELKEVLGGLRVLQARTYLRIQTVQGLLERAGAVLGAAPAPHPAH